MKSILIQKKLLAAVVIIGSLQSAYATGGGDVGSVILKNETSFGYACSVLAKSIKVEGSANNQAYRLLSGLKSVTVFKEKTLMSGQLESIAEGSLEFKPSNSIVSLEIKDASTRMISTVQDTKVYNKAGEQLKTEDQLESNFLVNYSHTNVLSKLNDETTRIEVSVTDSHNTDHVKFQNAKIKYSYKSPTTLPEETQKSLNGSVSFSLNCKTR